MMLVFNRFYDLLNEFMVCSIIIAFKMNVPMKGFFFFKEKFHNGVSV